MAVSVKLLQNIVCLAGWLAGTKYDKIVSRQSPVPRWYKVPVEEMLKLFQSRLFDGEMIF